MPVGSVTNAAPANDPDTETILPQATTTTATRNAETTHKSLKDDGDLSNDPKQDATAKVRARFANLLEEHGYGDLEVRDLVTAVAIHETLGLGVFAGSFALCYAVQPSLRLANTPWAHR